MALVSASVGVLLKVALCKYWDLSGAIWATNLSYLMIIIPALLSIVPRCLRERAVA